MGVDIVYNHADYRLASSRVLNHLADFREVNLFLRGLFPLIGFKTDYVYYDRLERFAGESKYPFLKMLSFALDGITSFSILPLRFIVFLGVLIFIISIVLSLWVLVQWFKGDVVVGWASTVLPIYFIGGIQIISLGVIGEYIGKIYKETKSRPQYINEIELF
jgi:glycosyltransferase involved in cell wall biosynthesis